MVWHTLCEAIQWMESMACVKGRHDPFVMGLMECLVNFWVVQASVDPADEKSVKTMKKGNCK